MYGDISEESIFYYSFPDEGVHKITFRVLDSKGLWSAYANRTLYVVLSQNIPSVTITDPTSDHMFVSEDFIVFGDAYDEDFVEFVEYSIDGGSWWMTDGTYTFSISVSVDGMAPGTNHTLEIKANNGNHYSDVTTIYFTIEDVEEEEEEDGDDDDPNYMLLAVALGYMGHGCLAHEESAFEIDRQNLVPFIAIDVCKCR